MCSSSVSQELKPNQDPGPSVSLTSTEMSKYLPDQCLDPFTFHSVMDAANAKYHLARVSAIIRLRVFAVDLIHA